MPDSTRPALAVGAALDWELRAVLSALGDTRRGRHGDIAVWVGRSGPHRILVYRTGVGIQAAARRTSALLSGGAIAALINTGCAGGISAALRPGAIVIADEIVGPLPDLARYPTSPTLAERLRAAATWAGTAVGGTVLTSPEPLSSAASKRQHWDAHAAAAVDMESAAVSAAAAACGTPLASLRAILDTADTDLPDAAFLPPGERLAHALQDAFRAPRTTVDFAKLRLAQRAARVAIETSFRRFFENLDETPLLV